MASILDQLVDWIVSFFGGQSGESGSVIESLFDIALPIVMVGFVIVASYFVIRAYKYASSYAGDGEPLGPFKITIQGLTQVKGNLSRHYFVSDQEYDLLKSIDQQDVAKNIQDFRERIDSGKLFIYDFRITDYDEAFDLHGGKDSLVLSPVDLEDNEFSWIDSKGERSLLSPTFRIKHRNVVCFSASRYTPDQVMAERDVDIYDLVPIPKFLSEMKIKDEQVVVLHLTKLANAISDGTYSEYMRTISENWQEIKPLRDEIERLRKKLVDKDQEISDVHRMGEHDRHMAYTNPLIGVKKLPKEKTVGSFFGMLMMMFFAGGMSALLPEMIPQLNISGLLTLMAGAGVVGLIVYMAVENKDKKKEPEQN